ncbi:MAG TPA: PQQ-dependent sugar dehydrogenase [Actinomycetes bacterium]|nr:PQQ-dependent sugar dehydrogenase [Actinomycetes bacterium]
MTPDAGPSEPAEPAGPSDPSRKLIAWIAIGVVVAVLVVAGAWWLLSEDDDPAASPDDTASTSPSPSPSGSVKSSQSVAPGKLPALGQPRDIATNLDVPWGVAFLPDGSALVSERTTGEIVQVAPGERTRTIGEVPGVTPDVEGGLLGIAVSPNYAQDRLVYAYFTTESDNRVVAMKHNPSGFGKPTVLIDGIPRATLHDGGRLVFGPDGMLYVTTGDHGEPELAQDRSSLAGKILRITPDGDVPSGNPFKGSPVWSYGHRNVQGLAFDEAGRLWATEFGDSRADELNLIKPGNNYGWPTYEGDGGAQAESAGFTNPQLTWPVEDASPSGLAWRDGVLYMGALRGERLWQIPLDGDRALQPKAALEDELGRIRTVEVAANGDLWITTSNTDGRTPDVADDDDRVVSVSVG